MARGLHYRPSMKGARLTAADVAARARKLVAERIGPAAAVAGPRLVNGRWEVGVWYGCEGCWAEIVRLRFDALGRLTPVAWGQVYERMAALLAADPTVWQTVPGVHEPTLASVMVALGDVEPTTLLPNLAVWQARVRREMARWRRDGEPFCVAWAEVRVPDRDARALGHKGLYALWRLAARRMAPVMRDEDLLAAAELCRFALVVGADVAGTRRLVERLAARLARPFSIYRGGPTVRAWLRAGVCQVQDGMDEWDLAQAAREAMDSEGSQAASVRRDALAA